MGVFLFGVKGFGQPVPNMLRDSPIRRNCGYTLL